MFVRFLYIITRGRYNRHVRKRAAHAAIAKVSTGVERRSEGKLVSNMRKLKVGEQYVLRSPKASPVLLTVMRHEQGLPVCFARNAWEGENAIFHLMGWFLHSRTKEQSASRHVMQRPRNYSRHEYGLTVSFAKQGMSYVEQFDPSYELVRLSRHEALQNA